MLTWNWPVSMSAVVEVTNPRTRKHELCLPMYALWREANSMPRIRHLSRAIPRPQTLQLLP